MNEHYYTVREHISDLASKLDKAVFDENWLQAQNLAIDLEYHLSVIRQLQTPEVAG